MDRDATFLLSLAMLAVAALAIGVTGWILFVRDRRGAAPDHHAGVEDS